MSVRILTGDALEQLRGLPAESVQCCVTSPPYYGLRCYGTEGQIGLEETPEAHIARLVEVFAEVRRVLRRDGVLWLNYGDAYAHSGACGGASPDGPRAHREQGAIAQRISGGTLTEGYKPKDLLMLPSRVALALQADGWWLRSMLPWVKRSAMPESVTDRPATAIEYVFLLSKSARYFFDMEAVRAPLLPSTLERGYTAAYMDGVETGKTAAAPDDVRAKENWRENGYVPTGRNFRNSDLFYASLAPPHGLISGAGGDGEGAPLALDVNPAGFSQAHFATFPPKLIEPLIKAATSEKGCCSKCGALWVRDVENQKPDRAPREPRAKAVTSPRHDGNAWNENDGRGFIPTDSKTLGWSPSCGCNVEPAYPCTVLDPFGGAMTTGLVADRLGRDAVLIELNPEYAEMARARIQADGGLFSDVRDQGSTNQADVRHEPSDT